MKNLKKIFLFTLAAGILFSCEDAYNIDQYGEYREDIAIQSIDDMGLALTELYDNVSTEDIISFTSVFTDETAIGVETGGQNQAEYRFQLFATSGFASGIWLQNYAVINSANRIIEGSENVIIDPASPTADSDLVEKNRILGEARALRAFAHFQLMTYFSTDLKNDSALGVILLDHVPPLLPNVEQLPRSTNGDLFNFINSDLDYADANMVVGASNIFVTRNFVTALRARIALYRGDYANALTFANSAIAAASPLNGGLASRAQYSAIFNPGAGGEQSLTEVIFGLERPNGKRGIVSEWFFNGASLAGGPFMEVSRSLYNALLEAPGDIRTSVIVGPTSVIAEDFATVFDYKNADILIPYKYPGNPARNLPLLNRIAVFRVSELYLIKAEAQIGTGDLTGALTTLNFLRARRINPPAASVLPAFGSEMAAWKAVLDERRKELAFEGHRYIDLKRLGTLAGVPGVQRYERDCAPFNACELLVTDPKFTLP
ncbi:MAG: RagB/SusD family nutrient uptake outer membrane protein, partial [Flavobacterium sp.]